MQFVPYNGKVADLQENDTAKHTCDLSAYVPSNTVCILISASRVSGSGYLNVYPNEGTSGVTIDDAKHAARAPFAIGIAAGSQRFQWNNTVANDDWDVYMYGYWVGFG